MITVRAGSDSAYRTLHQWVQHNLGKPNKCEKCGATDKANYQWANKSHDYKKDLSDWIRLCVPCHKLHDQKESCANGHKFTKENTYTHPTKNKRGCRICRNENRKKYNNLQRRTRE